MIKFLLELHRLSYGSNEHYKYKETNKIKWIICVVVYISTRCLFFYYMKLREMFRINPSFKGIVNDEIVVSLTSFPARINNVWMVIDSICKQKMRPSMINLYLSIEEFPNRHNNLPYILKKYEKCGLRISWVENNLMPHKKYFYAMQEFCNKYIITIDDDIYYRDDMISRLWEMSISARNCVCANRVTPMLDTNFKLKRYNQWGKDVKAASGKSFNYLAVGTCGVLYPPNTFQNSDLFNINKIIKNCVRADDLWLKCHEILNEIPVMTGGFYCQSIEILGSQIISLYSTNCDAIEKSGNDIQWENLDNEYDVNKKLVELVTCEKECGIEAEA